MATRIELPELKRLLDEGAQLVEVLPEREYADAHLSRPALAQPRA